MIKVCKMLIIVVIIAVFPFVSAAKEPEEYIEEFENIVPKEAEKIIDGEKDLSASVGFRALVCEAVAVLDGGRGELFSFLALLFGSAILLSLSSAYEGVLSDVAEAGVGAVVSLLIFSRMNSHQDFQIFSLNYLEVKHRILSILDLLVFHYVLLIGYQHVLNRFFHYLKLPIHLVLLLLLQA